MIGGKLQRGGLILATVMTTAGMLFAQRPAAKTETAVFAGGCFWGIQAVFQHTKGVTSAVSGYSGGWTDKPSYEMVGSGTTGHAESVQVTFDPARISYATLLKIFFSVAHDPTQLNRQGPDVGTQYRSSLFYMSDEQKKTAESYIDVLNKGARVWQTDRHRGREVQGVLPGRSVPSGLRGDASERAVHPGQRCAEGGESSEAVSRAV